MTREDAIDILEEVKQLDDSIYQYNTKYLEALDVAIKVLEQTKNDDCISRTDAIQAIQKKAKKLTNTDTINGLCGAVAILFDLPSVTPQEPKTGHWIRVAGGSLIDDYRCDCCNHQPPIRKVGSTWGWDFTDYCPNCGAKMDEEQKVRDKE